MSLLGRDLSHSQRLATKKNINVSEELEEIHTNKIWANMSQIMGAQYVSHPCFASQYPLGETERRKIKFELFE